MLRVEILIFFFLEEEHSEMVNSVINWREKKKYGRQKENHKQGGGSYGILLLGAVEREYWDFSSMMYICVVNLYL